MGKEIKGEEKVRSVIKSKMRSRDSRCDEGERIFIVVVIYQTMSRISNNDICMIQLLVNNSNIITKIS